MSRRWCDQCNPFAINGIAMHEAGCPNDGARWDAEREEWVPQRTCFICGYECDMDDECCHAIWDEDVPEVDEDFWYDHATHFGADQ